MPADYTTSNGIRRMVAKVGEKAALSVRVMTISPGKLSTLGLDGLSRNFLERGRRIFWTKEYSIRKYAEI